MTGSEAQKRINKCFESKNEVLDLSGLFLTEIDTKIGSYVELRNYDAICGDIGLGVRGFQTQFAWASY